MRYNRLKLLFSTNFFRQFVSTNYNVGEKTMIKKFSRASIMTRQCWVFEVRDNT